eukprot:CAMPEP_0114414808 /NCGR_PEP_ID=MMETSP0103-20121206/1581_1 /TAXON_ID=37642 ORGANISM="Paraphysomonas imperforata, Strain PA2" /NCGR_SAMPLE_ID=MMETSP0103 /ASSEMBLY_ACC=CAM_ASM_000201 /LENGTH=173 /DNA_ID=CAMNT_0001582965 /DNA_START=53 /DNA_END=575 /DNA_ORIENTATION=+
MTEKRSSTRITVLSKSMKTVDDATRKEVRNKRLRALEADNYNEEAIVDVSNEDNYSSEENEEDEPVSKRRRAKPPKVKVKAKLLSQQRTRRIRDLDRIYDSQKQQMQKSVLNNDAAENEIVEYNYASVEASSHPYQGGNFAPCAATGASTLAQGVACGTAVFDAITVIKKHVV